jgi:hypothetical protein
MAIPTAAAWKSVATQLATQNTDLEKEILSAQVLGREIAAARAAALAEYNALLTTPGLTTAQAYDARITFEQQDAALSAQREQVSSSRNQLINSVNDNNQALNSANTNATSASRSILNNNTLPGAVDPNNPDTVPAAPIPVTTINAPAAQAGTLDPDVLILTDTDAYLRSFPAPEKDPYQTSTDAVLDNIIRSMAEPPAAKDPYFTSDQAVQDAIFQDAVRASAARTAAGRAITPDELAQINQNVTEQRARDQQVLATQRNQTNDGDWRFKLSLAPNANYLYKAAAFEQLDTGQVSAAGIMQPLLYTDGVVFPYTPTVTTAYRANYSNYDLTHSNYRGYFYQNSAVEEINITGTFTAQDTKEANYLLAVIHFFRSVTKMFYGATDPLRGAPPPVCFLTGLGQYQFNYHPVLVSSFSYNLPNDVDYIRAGVASNNGTNLSDRRDLGTGTAAPNLFTSVIGRLLGIKAPPGGVNRPPPPPTLQITAPTYVPTKIDISLTLLPIQSREEVSKVFNLQQYANGQLLKGGFW